MIIALQTVAQRRCLGSVVCFLMHRYAALRAKVRLEIIT